MSFWEAAADQLDAACVELSILVTAQPCSPPEGRCGVKQVREGLGLPEGKHATESAASKPLSTSASNSAASKPRATTVPGTATTRCNRTRDRRAQDLSAYFTSIPPRTAAAAARSVRPSANCNTATSTNIPGGRPGRPRREDVAANRPSANTEPSSSRTRIASDPFAERSPRHPCSVASGTGGNTPGLIGTTTLPSRLQPDPAHQHPPPHLRRRRCCHGEVPDPGPRLQLHRRLHSVLADAASAMSCATHGPQA
ncbi:hypothetical protein ABIA35_000329 [Catenulispora sp. MAP12-49]